jgi:RHS repeat-associated protein
MRSNLHVDPSTGALQLQVPLGEYRGRGEASLPITLNYSSKVWNIKFVTSSSCSNEPVSALRADYAHNSASGWTSSVGWFLPTADVSLEDYDSYTLKPAQHVFRSPQDCCSSLFHIMRMFVTLPDGSRHELRRDDARHDPSESQAGIYYAVDGSRLWYDSAQDTLFMPNGSRLVHYSSGRITGNPPMQYVDRNGNFLTYSADSGMWNDTLNRHIGAPVGGTAPVAGDYSYTLPGFNDVPLTYTMRWRSLGDVRTDPNQPLRYLGDSPSANCGTGNPQSNNLFSTVDDQSKVLQGGIFNPVVLYQIVLPNGTTYTLTYNVYGEIDKITYPTGGIEQFTYGQVLPLGGQLDDGTYSQANRGVISRTVTDGVTTQLWQYGSPNDAGVDPATAARSVARPDGTVTKTWYYKSRGTDIQYGFDDARTGMAREERVYNSAGTMLRRTLFSVIEDGAQSGGYATATRNARVIKRVDIILDTGGNALASATEMAYDSDLNVISTKHYDYVSIDQAIAQASDIPAIPNGARLRTEETDYLTGDANYRALNLLSLPLATRVRDGSAGQGNIVAQSSISYDEAAYPLLDYGAANGWAEPGTNARGNPTSVSHWLNTTNTYLQSHVQYDHFGNVRKTWDAKGNLSQIDYSSSYQCAYPTTSTSADPDGAGPLTPLVTTNAYDLSSGVVTSTTDANNQTSTLEYASVDALANPNPMQRVTRVNRPDGGWTAYAYGDQPGNLFMLTRTALDATRSTESTKYFDALGRGWRSTMSEGAALIYSDQHYDSMGRVSQVSNPYRTGDTILWTTTGYDSFSRVVSVTTPDSSVVNSYYNGNQVLVRDQAGKERMSQMNGMGQLTDVWEITSADDATEAITFPNRSEVSAGYRTKYAYDTLGNLITVTQRVGANGLTQTRSFLYDSLARLTAATNPESGTINYDYDENGNLLHKIDPRRLADNVTQVEVTYDYDGLNRVKTRTYNDGTPTVTYSYDPNIANGKGRLSSVSSSVATYTYSSYDAMGRVLGGVQTLGGQTYPVHSTYDLSGHVTSINYPSNRTVTYAYDAAGRMNSVTGNLGDGGATRTYSTGISYDAASRMSQEQFGTNTPIYDKLAYNTRGQLAEMRASTTGGDDSFNRGKIVNDYSAQCSGAACNGTDNNGNLRKQTVLIPNDDQNANPTSWYQQYDYDSLNRLTQVQERASNDNLLWQQQYVYDRYGNRTLNNSSGATWGNNINSTAAAIDAGSNRLYATNDPNHTMIDYDAAGNQTKDYLTSNGTRMYDAENRMTSAIDSSYHTSTYIYDGDGRRVKRNLNGTETWQVYGLGGELLAEYAKDTPASTPQKEYGYRNGQLLITADAPTGARANVALASNGATATAQNYTQDGVYPGYHWQPSYAIDGQRYCHLISTGDDGTGFWRDEHGLSSWLEVDFNGAKAIDEVDVFSVGDYPGLMTQADPSPTQTFTMYAPTVFNVEYWNGSGWATVPGGSITNNNLLWRKIQFASITTARIRVTVSAASDGVARIAEVEAWGNATPPSALNVALASNGATATAQNYTQDGVYPGYHWQPSYAIDGQRYCHLIASGNDGNGFWRDEHGLSSWLEVDFNGAKTIDEVDVFSVGDSPGLLTQADPSPTQTFTMYAATAFNVEYWNGSGWATVPGGSITNNNLLWRKIRFASITTARIRVTVSAASDGVARIAEVEAWTASSGSSAQLHWLVTDQLGTPRMMFDQSGSLANVSRHDYLPFGEELFANTGGRAPALGYTNGDGARQKFTLKERDNETGLDYFGARYYSSNQGRFTGVDPYNIILEKQADEHSAVATRQFLRYLGEPQNWNRYVYVANNPLKYIDPDGEEIRFSNADSTQKLTAEQEEALRNAVTTLRQQSAAADAFFGVYDKAAGQGPDLDVQVMADKAFDNLPEVSGDKNTQASTQNGGSVPSADGKTTTTSAIIVIRESDVNLSSENQDRSHKQETKLEGIMSHEIVHANQVTNDVKSFLNASDDAKKNNIPYHDRPSEREANSGSKVILRERKDGHYIKKDSPGARW